MRKNGMNHKTSYSSTTTALKASKETTKFSDPLPVFALLLKIQINRCWDQSITPGPKLRTLR